jgi:hypothetical protein
MKYRIIEYSNNNGEKYFIVQYLSRVKFLIWGELWDDLPSLPGGALVSRETVKFTVLSDAQQYIRSQDWKWCVVEEVTT